MGSLTLAGEGSLDYQGTAKLVAAQGPITDLLSSISGVTFADGKLTIPFKIAGTLQRPRFVLKSARTGGSTGGAVNPPGPPAGQAVQQTGQTQQQPKDLVNGILGLLKKKPAAQPQQQPKQPKP
jgi:hypothetical protein